MKSHYLLILLSTFSISLVNCTHVSQLDKNQNALFLDPKGKSVSFDLSPDNLSTEAQKKSSIELGATTFGSEALCSGKKRAESAAVRSLEIELELRHIIDTLAYNKRRFLSETQQKIVNKTPICNPFLDELKTISLQLKGYQIQNNKSSSSFDGDQE